MYNDTIKLLNLEQFNIKFESINITKEGGSLFCYVKLERTVVSCPICGNPKPKIHDYKFKKIIHSISTNNPCFIKYKARRYKCKICDNVFFEPNPFALKNEKISTYTIHRILDALKSHTSTFTDIAKQFNLSVSSVINIFDQYVDCPRKTLPPIICMDEVYTSKRSIHKYAFVMVDFLKNEVIDVFSSRHKNRLTSELSIISKTERDAVRYIIIDMWDTYRDLAELYFKNALIAVDSFHVIQHLNQAITSIRLRVMRKFDKHTDSILANDIYYYMLKKFHYFFTKNYENIFNGQ